MIPSLPVLQRMFSNTFPNERAYMFKQSLHHLHVCLGINASSVLLHVSKLTVPRKHTSNHGSVREHTHSHTQRENDNLCQQCTSHSSLPPRASFALFATLVSRQRQRFSLLVSIKSELSAFVNISSPGAGVTCGWFVDASWHSVGDGDLPH